MMQTEMLLTEDDDDNHDDQCNIDYGLENCLNKSVSSSGII